MKQKLSCLGQISSVDLKLDFCIRFILTYNIDACSACVYLKCEGYNYLNLVSYLTTYSPGTLLFD